MGDQRGTASPEAALGSNAAHAGGSLEQKVRPHHPATQALAAQQASFDTHMLYVEPHAPTAKALT